jgi:hypothetical protein
MSTPEIQKAIELHRTYFAVLGSLNKFDEMEVRGVVNGVLSATLPEECFIATYYRAASNVSSLLELKSPVHYQAISMLARSLFELAVDIELLGTVQGAAVKMRAFLDLEKLRASRSTVAYRTSKGLTLMPSDQTHQSYIATNETRVSGLVSSLWPTLQPAQVKHWTGLQGLDRRVKLLSDEYRERYAWVSIWPRGTTSKYSGQ